MCPFDPVLIVCLSQLPRTHEEGSGEWGIGRRESRCVSARALAFSFSPPRMPVLARKGSCARVLINQKSNTLWESPLSPPALRISSRVPAFVTTTMPSVGGTISLFPDALQSGEATRRRPALSDSVSSLWYAAAKSSRGGIFACAGAGRTTYPGVSPVRDERCRRVRRFASSPALFRVFFFLLYLIFVFFVLSVRVTGKPSLHNVIAVHSPQQSSESVGVPASRRAEGSSFRLLTLDGGDNANDERPNFNNFHTLV